MKRVALTGLDEVDDVGRCTFAAWDRASLGDLQRTIERRRKELAG